MIKKASTLLFVAGKKYIPFVLYGLLALFVVGWSWFVNDYRYSFVVGKPAPITYYALTDATYEDLVATEKVRQRVQNGILGVVVRSSTERQAMNERYDQLLNDPLSVEQLQTPLAEALADMKTRDREELLAVVRSIHEDLLRGKMLTPEQKDDLIWQKMATLETDPAKANLAFQVILALTESADEVDTSMTSRIKDLAGKAVEPLVRHITIGDTIIERGAVVTPQVARQLRFQGFPEGSFAWTQLLIALIAALLVPLWYRSIQALHHTVWGGGIPGGFGFVFFMCAIGWFGEVLALRFGVYSLGSVLMTALFFLTQQRMIALLLSLVCGLSGALVTSGAGAAQAVVSLLGFLVAPLAAWVLFQGRFTRTLLFFKTLMLALSVSIATLFAQGVLLHSLGLSAVAALLVAILWSALTVVALPGIEALFDLLSPLRLMELTHPTHPLLRRLLTEAPGTYHHTQMVGNLAEAVAEKLGLNPLLLRAGASFHDIGKLMRPAYFIENQLSGVNAHDSLSPTMSAMVIINHVKDGLVLAEEYHLPHRIRDFIPEHHGTTCLTYFLKKAQADGQTPSADQFCYPGPKPRSKETAVLMLADSVEASARGSGDKIKRVSDIRNLIDSVIQTKVAMGQLDEAPFTSRDMALTKEALFTALRSMYHTRDIKPIREKKSEEKKDVRKNPFGRRT